MEKEDSGVSTSTNTPGEIGNDARLDDFAANAPVALCLVGLDGAIRATNKVAQMLLAGLGATTTLKPLCQAGAWAKLEGLLHDGAQFENFVLELRSGDDVRCVAINSSAWRDGAQVLQGARWALRDVTSREREVRTRALIDAIIDSSHDAIVSKQLDGRIMSWNRAAERLFGYTAEEAVGQSIRMIVPADRQAEEDDVLARLQRGEIVDHFQTVRQRKDGSLVQVSLTISPVRDRTGRIIGASKVARDISEQKAQEDELRRLLAAKDDFLGLVSHELRTPLTTLKGTANVLRRHRQRISEPDQEQALSDIERGADQMLRIVENMLTLARAETDNGAELEPVLLGRLAGQVVRERQSQPGTHHLVFEADENPLPVAGDVGYLRLILANLLSNAAKYSPAGSEIRVYARQAGEMGELRVEDSGIGIKPEEAAAIFSPFFRSANARAHASGIGLGLTVCMRLAEIQSGTIEATPGADGGAVFTLRLPLLPEGDGAAELTA
jgi:PAS domain S-box-containing protein